MFSSCHVKGTCYQCDLSLLTLTLMTWPRLLGIFMEAYSFLCPFLFYHLWKKVTTCSPHLRSRELWSTSVNMEYLQKLFGNLLHERVDSSPFICLFSRWYVSVWTHCFILWVVIQYCWIYFVAQVFPTLIIGSTFIWPLCTFDIHLLLWAIF